MQTFLMNGQTASEIKQSAVTFFCFPSLCDTHCERMGGEDDVPYTGSCLGRDSRDPRCCVIIKSAVFMNCEFVSQDSVLCLRKDNSHNTKC